MRKLIVCTAGVLALGALACLAAPAPLTGGCVPDTTDQAGKKVQATRRQDKLHLELQKLASERALIARKARERRAELKAQAAQEAAKLQAALEDIKAKTVAGLAAVTRERKELEAAIDAKEAQLKANLNGLSGARDLPPRRLDSTLERILDRLEMIERRLDTLEKSGRASKRQLK
jgi:hypothetical protein